MVVDKPAGISIHNDPGRDLCSLLADHIQVQDQVVKHSLFDASFGLHAAHRLDKQTSGLLVLAGKQDAFRYFSDLFAHHRIVKKYLALVHGKLVEAPPSDEWGRWTYPLAPKSGGRLDPQGQGKRSSATTFFRLVGLGVHYSFIECRIQTGRTHQIRRHAALAGHTVVGDARYGTQRACRFLQQQKGFSRSALHASCLTFQPPEPGRKACEIHSRLPEAICRLMAEEFDKGIYEGY